MQVQGKCKAHSTDVCGTLVTHNHAVIWLRSRVRRFSMLLRNPLVSVTVFLNASVNNSMRALSPPEDSSLAMPGLFATQDPQFRQIRTVRDRLAYAVLGLSVYIGYESSSVLMLPYSTMLHGESHSGGALLRIGLRNSWVPLWVLDLSRQRSSMA